MKTTTVRRKINKALEGWGYRFSKPIKRKIVDEIWKAILPLTKKETHRSYKACTLYESWCTSK